MAQTPDLVSNGFRYGKTFWEVEREVNAINGQISIWDYLAQK